MRRASAFGSAVASVLTASLAGASILTPPTLPLIVRNPYLNTHFLNARDEPWTKWPTFWTGEEVRCELMSFYLFPAETAGLLIASVHRGVAL